MEFNPYFFCFEKMKNNNMKKPMAPIKKKSEKIND